MQVGIISRPHLAAGLSYMVGASTWIANVRAGSAGQNKRGGDGTLHVACFPSLPPIPATPAPRAELALGAGDNTGNSCGCSHISSLSIMPRVGKAVSRTDDSLPPQTPRLALRGPRPILQGRQVVPCDKSNSLFGYLKGRMVKPRVKARYRL